MLTKAWKLARIMAKHGVAVIPVPPKEKGCKLGNWPDLASTDLNQIEEWAQAEPDGNYGAVCSPDTVVALDADNPGLSSYVERATGKDFPATLTVKSSKGYHYYFLQTDRTRAMGNRKVAAMFDLQSDRKYVVGPGSIHPSGSEYTIINNEDIVPMPDWLADYLGKWSAPPKPKAASGPEVDEDFEPSEWYDFNDISGRDDGEWYVCDECPVAGHKHEQSTRTGFYWNGSVWGWNCFAAGCEGSNMSIGDVVAFINKKRRDAGLPLWKQPIWQEDDSDLEGVDDADSFDLNDLIPQPDEVKQSTMTLTESDVREKEEQQEPEEAKKTSTGLKALASTSTDELELMLVTRSAADYVMEELRWMWPQKIPSGKMVFFTGKPDCGKTMCALDVAARVTTGADWPDGSKNDGGPGRVLIAASEDDPNDTLVPRLAAAGADLHNVEIVVGTVVTIKDKKRKKNTLNLKRDAKMLIEAIKANPDIKLLILDPISSFLGDADQNKDKDIRPIMDALKTTCEKSGLTIIGLIHSNKRSDVDAIGKVSGATALGASVRAVWGFSKDPEDKDKFHMAHVKGNLTKDKSGLDYNIVEAVVDIQSKQVGVPRIVWGAKFEGDADDLLEASRDRKDKSDVKKTVAKALLRGVIKYPAKATDVYRQGEAEGITGSTLKKAKIELAQEGFTLIAKKQFDGWWWYKLEDDGTCYPVDKGAIIPVETLDNVA
jgi:putative DNA primase/helicase